MPTANRRAGSLLDLHVHSTCSVDGASNTAEYAQRAEKLGLLEVGFCEHADFDPRDPSYSDLDLARYDGEIAAARAAFPGVCLRQGVEITYQADREMEIRAWLAGHAWDYVVASVHLVDYADGWAIVSEPQAVERYFAAHSCRQSYVPYFEELLRAVRSGLGTVLGHLDLIKRYGVGQYGHFEPAEFEEEIRAVLGAAVECGVGLELNISGLRQLPGEPYPTLTVLRWYREMGGEILTVGSDTHHVDHLGHGLRRALALAWEADFRALTTFEAGQARWIDLEPANW